MSCMDKHVEYVIIPFTAYDIALLYRKHPDALKVKVKGKELFSKVQLWKRAIDTGTIIVFYTTAFPGTPAKFERREKCSMLLHYQYRSEGRILYFIVRISESETLIELPQMEPLPTLLTLHVNNLLDELLEAYNVTDFPTHVLEEIAMSVLSENSIW